MWCPFQKVYQIISASRCIVVAFKNDESADIFIGRIKCNKNSVAALFSFKEWCNYTLQRH